MYSQRNQNNIVIERQPKLQTQWYTILVIRVADFQNVTCFSKTKLPALYEICLFGICVGCVAQRADISYPVHKTTITICISTKCF